MGAGDVPLPLGTRVLLGGRHAATVRYVGPVDGQIGSWVGIEYDEPGRGKHDGSHAGRRYFSCAGGPASGSLVRLPKFLEAADCGRSLVEAARERYGSSGSSSRASGGGDGGAADRSGEGDGEGGVQRMYLSTAGNRRVAVELVEKAGGAAARRASASGAGGAVLAGQRISSVGPAAELRQALQGLTELDLSNNLISSWAFVAELAAALPSLHTLNLSGNRLALPSLPEAAAAADAPAAPALTPGSGSNAEEHGRKPRGSTEGDSSSTSSSHTLGQAGEAAPPAALPVSLAAIQTLALNGCGASWQQAVAIAQQLVNLRELHLCNNGMSILRLLGPSSSGAGGNGGSEGPSTAFASLSLRSPSDGSRASHSPLSCKQLLAAAFPRLEVLDLEGNTLSSWADVAALSSLPRLRSLLLSGNCLADVHYTGGFTSLRSLLLGSNCLGNWSAVDALNRFPALEEARLSDNPLTAAAPSSARYRCIARVRGLTTLNASAVSPAERWDAEINYLRLVTDELAAAAQAAAAAGRDAAAAREAVLAANPRFGELTQKYGELTPAAPNAATGSALAASMAQLTVCHNGKRVTKKLPVSLTVGKLKVMLERLLRVKAAQQALLLVPPESSGAQPEDITDDDTRELRYYDVCDGCRLEVSTADPAARAAALAAANATAAALHAERMEQHEKTIQQFRAVEQRLMA